MKKPVPLVIVGLVIVVLLLCGFLLWNPESVARTSGSVLCFFSVMYVVVNYYDLMERYRFYVVFGFDPRIKWDLDGVGQAVVDNIISEFAARFDRNCREEGRLLRERADAVRRGHDSRVCDFEGPIRSARRRVVDSKSEFWAVHALVKIGGFKVRPKVSDYVHS